MQRLRFEPRRALSAMVVLAILAGSSLAGVVPAEIHHRDVTERPSVSLTVYNQDFALVKDVRTLELIRGTDDIRIDDVAAAIDPTSVHFAALDHPGAVAVLEQNYRYDLAGADRLLDRYLGLGITAVLKEGEVRDGRLLSHDPGTLVLGTEDGGAVILNRTEVQDLRLGEVPGGLVVRPTLVWSLASDRQGLERTEISYLTNRIGWHAEYVAVVSADDTALDLDGWVSIDNRSGATYPDARLKLVAGDVHRVQERMQMPRRAAADHMEVMAAAPQFEEREFFEYHLYALERPATVADRETKQLSLFPSAKAGAVKRLVFDAMRRGTKVAVEMEFENAEANGLGMALPAGKVRVYKEDADGALEFVGEDAVDHTPRDEKVRLYLGNAFDVVAERKRADYRRISDRTHEETVEIEIRNHKDETVEVTVVEHLSADWTMLRQSHEFEKKDAHTVEFPVRVAADETVTVSYTVRTTW